MTGTSVTRAAGTVPRVIDAEHMSFADMLAMGNTLVTTGFLPAAIKTGAQAAAIILTGRELGMQPMRALRSLSLVKGKVTENADSQLARFKTDGGRAVWKQLDATAAVLHLVHPNGDEHTESFTMADAKAAGLTLPAPGGERSMYDKHAKAMLRSRSITAGMKSIGWEGGSGVYDPEELPTSTPPRSVEARDDVRAALRVVATDSDTGEVFYGVDEDADEDQLRMGQADNMDMVSMVSIDDSARAPSAAPRTTAFDADEPFRFGKYKALTIREVGVIDAQYLGWYYKTEKEKARNGEKYAKTEAWVGGFKAFIKSLGHLRDDVATEGDTAGTTPTTGTTAWPAPTGRFALNEDITDDDLPF